MSRIYATSTTVSVIFATGGSGAICDLESSATESPALLAIDVSMVEGSAETIIFGLGIASNTPVPSFSIAFAPEYPNDPPCTSIMATAWSLAPAVPTNYFRSFKGVSGASTSYNQLLTFPRGLKISPSSSLALWNTNTSTFARMNVSWEIEV